ncbi:MAG TPA: 3-oxoadipate enol-lactonase [Streptosporangiaceae bacterium]
MSETAGSETAGSDTASPGAANSLRPGAPGSAPVQLRASLDGPAGAPVVVLGNSLGTTGELWRPQLDALGKRFRVMRFEHRGHGGSPASAGPYSIGDLATDVLRLLDENGIDRASYCGVSLGGMVGMWLAATAPARITALALCSTSAWLRPASMWRERAAQVRAGGMSAISQQVVGRWFTAAFRERDPATVASFVTMVESTNPEGYAGCCEAIATMDLRPILPSITAPAQVIAGAEDPATPPWHGAVIASGIRNARLHVIRGAAHLANISQPGEFTAALLAHLTAQ